MTTLTPFSEKVLRLIRSIPRGKVTTYGQIAKLAGKPHGSRGVSWLLHSCSKSHRLPWQRVLNSQGKVSFPESSRAFVLQKILLKKEGVVFEIGRTDLKKYGWAKKK